MGGGFNLLLRWFPFDGLDALARTAIIKTANIATVRSLDDAILDLTFNLNFRASQKISPSKCLLFQRARNLKINKFTFTITQDALILWLNHFHSLKKIKKKNVRVWKMARWISCFQWLTSSMMTTSRWVAGLSRPLQTAFLSGRLNDGILALFPLQSFFFVFLSEIIKK